MQQPLVELLVWMRVPGDTIFSIGAITLAWFVLRLWIAPRKDTSLPAGAETADR
jgi:nitric oxide reductase subunit B